MKYDHIAQAEQNFASGMNCAQAVLAAYSDITGLDESFALRLASSFGGGMGRMREVCGTCSAMFMIAGLLYGPDQTGDDKEKGDHYRRIQELAAEFRAEHETIICRDLLKGLAVTDKPEPDKRTAQYYKVRPCIRFVRTAAEILDRYLEAHPLPEQEAQTCTE